LKTLISCALALCLAPLAPAAAVTLYSNGPLNGTVHGISNAGFGAAGSFQDGTSLANGGGQPGSCPNGRTTCTGSETFGIHGDLGIAAPEPGSLGLLGCAILALAGVLLWRRERRRASFVTSLEATIRDWNLLAHRIRLSHSHAQKNAIQPKTKAEAA